MDSAKIITRLNNLEAAANLILDECRKTKKEIGSELKPKKLRHGEMTEDERTRIMLKRMNRRRVN